MKSARIRQLLCFSVFGLMIYASISTASETDFLVVSIDADEGYGDYTVDSSGYNNHAILNNIDWHPGKNGTALYFDGISAFAEINNDPNNLLFNIHQHNFSLSAWVKPTEDLSWRSGIITRWGVHQGLFYTGDNRFTFIHRLPSGNKTVRTLQPYPPGEFYHVAVTIDGSQGKLNIYVNGQLDNSTVYKPEQADYRFFRPWRLGIKDPSQTTPMKRESFVGVLDEVRFFNKALEANMINELAETTEPECGTDISVEPTEAMVPTYLTGNGEVSFEQSSVPSLWASNKGKLSIVQDIAKHGNKSLNWQWVKGDVLEISDLQSQGLIVEKIDKTNYTQSSFRIWLHNELALKDDAIRVEFYDDKQQLQYFYTVNLNFTGWRAASVKYRTDMDGDKSNQNLTTMKIHAPSSVCEGVLKIDLVDFTAPKNLVQGGDRQVPMAAYDIDNHWTNMLKYEKYQKLPSAPATQAERVDSLRMKEEYRKHAIKSKGSIQSLQKAIDEYQRLGITYRNNNIVADIPLFGPRHTHKDFGITINDIDKYIMVFAQESLINKDEIATAYFISLIQYMLEQGFADGSMMENMSHVGYTVRNITNAILLMEESLKQAGLWSQAFAAISWYNALEEIWQPVSENESNVDHANTRINYILGIILHIDDTDKRVQYLKGFTQHVEVWLTAYDRGGNGLKPDYSAFHHNTFYPGYVYGAISSISQAVGNLANTVFAVHPEKLQFLINTISSYNVHHVNRDMPISISGRNPWKTPTLANALLALAKATKNDQFYKVYNRLFGITNISQNKGIEPNPSGFWQFNYRPMGVYRKDNWVANIKGLSNYFWGSEIYASQNRYGRYQSYGSIIINYQLPESLRSSSSSIRGSGGYTEDGWNWNIVPGATTKHLSWLNLVAQFPRQDEWNDKSFAGALRFGKNKTPYVDDELEGQCGIFGLDFKQREATSSTHDGSFTFKKSVFACNGIIITLGSNINSHDTQNNIATNLFQQSIIDAPYNLVVNKSKIQTDKFNHSKPIKRDWIVDLYGTGYFIKQGGLLELHLRNQESPKQNSNDTSKLSSGKFATAWLNHGKAPENAKYEYVIVPNANKKRKSWPSIASEINSAYRVLQQDQYAHVIHIPKEQLESYIVFEANNDISGHYLASTDTPILFMAQKKGNTLDVSLSNPNHNFAGKAPRWQENQDSLVTIELKGLWDIDPLVSELQSIRHAGNKTEITLFTQNANAYDFTLERHK